jgi:hAT family C-terminal dimerisation region
MYGLILFPGKGNPLLSLCAQFKDSTWLSSDVDELKNKSSFDLESYIQHMTKSSSYGDGIMLEMFLAKYKRPILIVSQQFVHTTKGITCDSILLSNSEVDKKKCVFLGYTGSNHYDSILPWPTIYTSVLASPDPMACTSESLSAVTSVHATAASESVTPLQTMSTPSLAKSDMIYSPTISLKSTSSVLSISETVDEQSTQLHDGTVQYPIVWKFDKWNSWKEKQPWLICQNGKLGCQVCCEAGTTLSVQTGVHISAEWTSKSVEAKSARKLKEKIYKHKNSQAHNAAVNILKIRQQECLKCTVADADSRHFVETCRVFRTAYAISKMNLAFTALKELLVLQEANGLDLGQVHRSDHSCAKIINHISKQMKSKFCERLKTLGPHVAVLLDESTLYKTSVIAVYLRTRLADITEVMPEVNYGVTNVFFGLLEAHEGCTAKGIMKEVQSEFEKFKLQDDLLLKNNSLIAICTDGASVMTGSSNGVATKFVESYGNHVETFHCLAHRLELAVDDALKSVTATNHFQAILNSLFALYSMSPKNQRELREVAADTETELLRITALFSVRWVASSFRAVSAVWRNYPALHGHFVHASLDNTRSATERAKFQGLAKKLSTVSFLKDLSVMKDVLRELSFLSLKLQSRTCNMVTSYAEVNTTMAVLRALRNAGGGKSTKRLVDTETTHTFKGVPLTDGRPGINAGQFLTAIIDYLHRRACIRSPLLEDLQKLYKANWPPADSDELILYGEESVTRLAKRLCLPIRPVVEAFRKYKVESGKPQPELVKLLAAAETYPGSTAECERGFSAMNEMVWEKRNRLNVDTLSNTMFIKLNGVSVANFDPYPYVQSWIAAGNRLSSSWITGPKPCEQSNTHQNLVEKLCVEERVVYNK